MKSMQNITVFAVLLCSICFSAHATIRYVKPGGTGSGTSWATAGDLQKTVDASTDGDEIWAMMGEYTSANIQVLKMKEGVSVFGGFVGSETARGQRDFESNPSVINGMNTGRCVTGAANATLDGFTVKNGYAENGGGMYTEGEVRGKAVHCTFSYNKSIIDGGGMYNCDADNCRFNNNEAKNGHGGGMYEGTATNCVFTANSATVGEQNYGGGKYQGEAVNCTFEKNNADFGGGMFGGTAKDDCEFISNVANTSGGGMYNGTATNCTFTSNAAKYGGGMYLGKATGCTFTSNSAKYSGGGASRCEAINCTFTANSSSGTYKSGGGAMYDGNATDCTFNSNSAYNGGGMYLGTGTNCKFNNNETIWDGGGLYAGTATNCRFESNKAGQDGGGMYGGTATNCKFFDNTAIGDGGGLYDPEKATNCTFNNNTANSQGGGTYLGTASYCSFTSNVAKGNGGGMYKGIAENCIIWNNRPNEVYESGVTYSCLSVTFLGTGNIVADPLFANPENDDLRLREGSPCIDILSDPTPPQTDIRGVSRPQEDLSDIGAYEYISDDTTYVPNIVSQSQTNAETMVKSAGLIFVPILECNETIPAGQVMRQDPEAEQSVPTETAVTAVVSSGPCPIVVPDVVNRAQSIAVDTLTGAGLVVGSMTPQCDNVIAMDIVIGQDPGPGMSVPPGTSVALVISTGPCLITVPSVVNVTQAIAETTITGAGLVVSKISQACDEMIPAGTVISQDPAAGQSVMPGSGVALVVSTGKCPVTTPNVVNMTQSAAEDAIVSAGLVVSTISEQCSATVAAGKVISQDPAAGQSVTPGSAVALVVSTGKCSITVPNVVNFTQSAAEDAIVGAGLVVGNVKEQCSATVAAGRVISQNPAAGQPVTPGATIALVVSTGGCLWGEGEEEGEEGESPNLTLDEARDVLSAGFDHIDTNNNDLLSIFEARQVIPGLTWELFDQLDADGDGVLSRDELGEETSACGCGGASKDFKTRMGDFFTLILGLMVLPLLTATRK